MKAFVQVQPFVLFSPSFDRIFRISIVPGEDPSVTVSRFEDLLTKDPLKAEAMIFPEADLSRWATPGYVSPTGFETKIETVEEARERVGDSKHIGSQICRPPSTQEANGTAEMTAREMNAREMEMAAQAKCPTSVSRVSKITVARLYNLGNYEHIRYELTVDVPEGQSPATALIGVEKIIAALSPKTHTHSRQDLEREQRSLDTMRHLLTEHGVEEFNRRHGGYQGTPDEYLARCEKSHAENVSQRDAWEARLTKARQLLEDLGGAANWKDAKLDWQDDNDEL